MNEVDYEKFGCEIAKSTSGRERRFSQKIGLKNLIAVPVRTKGVSSQGVHNNCLANVIRMVYRYGGQMLVGWSYRETPAGAADDFLRHAVWVNPEGRAVCLTPANHTSENPTTTVTNSEGEWCVALYPTATYSQSEIISIVEKGEGKLQWAMNNVFKEKAGLGYFPTDPETFTNQGANGRFVMANPKTLRNMMSLELPVTQKFLDGLKSKDGFLPEVFE